MAKVNWGRLLLGSLIAAVLCFVTDGLMHNMLIHEDWKGVYTALKATPPTDHDPMSFAYFGLLEIGRGFVTMFLYIMMRARMGAGPKTAVWAGVVSWVAFSLTGPAQYIPLGLMSCAVWLKAAGFQLVTSVGAALAGAAPYKEKK